MHNPPPLIGAHRNGSTIQVGPPGRLLLHAGSRHLGVLRFAFESRTLANLVLPVGDPRRRFPSSMNESARQPMALTRTAQEVRSGFRLAQGGSSPGLCPPIEHHDVKGNPHQAYAQRALEGPGQTAPRLKTQKSRCVGTNHGTATLKSQDCQMLCFYDTRGAQPSFKATGGLPNLKRNDCATFGVLGERAALGKQQERAQLKAQY